MQPDPSPVQEMPDDDERAYLEFVKRGSKLVKTQERSRWELGDLACEVATRWDRKRKTIIALGRAIRMARPRTLYDYLEVSEFYPPVARAYLAEHCKHITWSHCRAAQRAATKKGLDVTWALGRLVIAHDNNMFVEEFTEVLTLEDDTDYMPKHFGYEAQVIKGRVVEEAEGPAGYVLLKLDSTDVGDLLLKMKGRSFAARLSISWEEKVLKDGGNGHEQDQSARAQQDIEHAGIGQGQSSVSGGLPSGSQEDRRGAGPDHRAEEVGAVPDSSEPESEAEGYQVDSEEAG